MVTNISNENKNWQCIVKNQERTYACRVKRQELSLRSKNNLVMDNTSFDHTPSLTTPPLTFIVPVNVCDIAGGSLTYPHPLVV